MALVFCGIVYLLDAATGTVDASSVWGMIYGAAATAFMIGSAVYAVRRRTMRFGVGRARSWQQFHIYGGSLFLLLTLMHSAFRFPQGAMTAWLLLLSVWIFVSGLIGLFIQKWIPKLLSTLSVEAIYERIPELVEDLRNKAETIVEESPVPVKDFYETSLAPAMVTPTNRLRYFGNVSAGLHERSGEFELLRTLVSAEDRERVVTLENIYVSKLELDAHYTLQKALRWWLFLHVPPSLVLLVLVALHIFSVFYY